MKNILFLFALLFSFSLCAQKPIRNIGREQTVPLSSAVGIPAIVDSADNKVGRLVNPAEIATNSQLQLKASQTALSDSALQLRSDFASTIQREAVMGYVEQTLSVTSTTNLAAIKTLIETRFGANFKDGWYVFSITSESSGINTITQTVTDVSISGSQVVLKNGWNLFLKFQNKSLINQYLYYGGLTTIDYMIALLQTQMALKANSTDLALKADASALTAEAATRLAADNNINAKAQRGLDSIGVHRTELDLLNSRSMDSTVYRNIFGASTFTLPNDYYISFRDLPSRPGLNNNQTFSQVYGSPVPNGYYTVMMYGNTSTKKKIYIQTHQSTPYNGNMASDIAIKDGETVTFKVLNNEIVEYKISGFIGSDLTISDINNHVYNHSFQFSTDYEIDGGNVSLAELSDPDGSGDSFGAMFADPIPDGFYWLYGSGNTQKKINVTTQDGTLYDVRNGDVIMLYMYQGSINNWSRTKSTNTDTTSISNRITAEAATRLTVDNTINTKAQQGLDSITVHRTAIDNLSTTKANNSDLALKADQTALNTEITNRINADSLLWKIGGNDLTIPYVDKATVGGFNAETGKFVTGGGSMSAYTYGSNLVTNGYFSSGNTAFSSDYGSTTTRDTTSANADYYRIGTAPITNWTSYTEDFRVNGNIMVCNGEANANRRAWYQSGISVVAGTKYQFQVDAYALNIQPYATSARLYLTVNGTIITDTIWLTTANRWVTISGQYTANTTTTVTLAVANACGSTIGNDFALDNIQFRAISTGSQNSFFRSIETENLSRFGVQRTTSRDVSNVTEWQTLVSKDSISYRVGTSGFQKYTANGDITYLKGGSTKTVANTGDITALYKSKTLSLASGGTPALDFESGASIVYVLTTVLNGDYFPTTTMVNLRDGGRYPIRFVAANTGVVYTFPANVYKKDGSAFGAYSVVSEILDFICIGSNLYCTNK